VYFITIEKVIKSSSSKQRYIIHVYLPGAGLCRAPAGLRPGRWMRCHRLFGDGSVGILGIGKGLQVITSLAQWVREIRSSFIRV